VKTISFSLNQSTKLLTNRKIRIPFYFGGHGTFINPVNKGFDAFFNIFMIATFEDCENIFEGFAELITTFVKGV